MSPKTDPILDHQGLEILDAAECWRLVASVPVGRIAFVDAGEPMILPVNHGVLGHRLVFRTARGALLHEALMQRPIAFEADAFDREARSGWSVLVRGQAALADDDALASETVEGLGLDAWADAVDRDEWVLILAEEVSGRRIVRRED